MRRPVRGIGGIAVPIFVRSQVGKKSGIFLKHAFTRTELISTKLYTDICRSNRQPAALKRSYLFSRKAGLGLSPLGLGIRILF